MLFDENDTPIDYRFLETNPAFGKQTGLVEVIGKRMLQLAPTHEKHWFEIYGKIAMTGRTASLRESRRSTEPLVRRLCMAHWAAGEPKSCPTVQRYQRSQAH
jgi:PAS domain-containing protein